VSEIFLFFFAPIVNAYHFHSRENHYPRTALCHRHKYRLNDHRYRSQARTRSKTTTMCFMGEHRDHQYFITVLADNTLSDLFPSYRYKYIVLILWNTINAFCFLFFILLKNTDIIFCFFFVSFFSFRLIITILF